MPLPIFAAAVFLAAFVMSIPIGPIQLEIWRESLAGNRANAWAYQVGSIVATLIWVLTAAFGMSLIGKSRFGEAAAFFLYAALLVGFGAQAIRKSLRRASPLVSGTAAHNVPNAKPREGGLPRWALLRGFLLLAMNPLAAASWTVVLAWLIRWGATPPVRLLEAAVYALSVAVGMSVYPGLIIVNARRWLPKPARAGSSVLSCGLGGGLIAFGLYFLYRAIRILVGP
jgi:threonine/homoserine/homoserine lactone efflux protein